LQRWVDFVMQLPQAHHEPQEHGVGENHPQQEQQQESRASKSQNNQQQQQLPLHLLLLPVPPPPGAVATLSHPWPPQLLPGFSSQGLQGSGQGFGAGQLHKPWVVPQLLRMALTKQEPSLVLRGGAGSASSVATMLVSDVPHAPFRWFCCTPVDALLASIDSVSVCCRFSRLHAALKSVIMLW
jgi:hypothetical protein